MSELQKSLFERACALRASRMVKVDSYDQFKHALDPGGKGNFLLAHWDGTPETEKKIKEETKATIRCIPLEGEKETGRCVLTGARPRSASCSRRRIEIAVSPTTRSARLSCVRRDRLPRHGVRLAGFHISHPVLPAPVAERTSDAM